MQRVTDPSLLAQLEGGSPSATRPVTDPAIIAQLEGKSVAPSKAPTMSQQREVMGASRPGTKIWKTPEETRQAAGELAGTAVDMTMGVSDGVTLGLTKPLTNKARKAMPSIGMTPNPVAEGIGELAGTVAPWGAVTKGVQAATGLNNLTRAGRIAEQTLTGGIVGGVSAQNQGHDAVNSSIAGGAFAGIIGGILEAPGISKEIKAWWKQRQEYLSNEERGLIVRDFESLKATGYNDTDAVRILAGKRASQEPSQGDFARFSPESRQAMTEQRQATEFGRRDTAEPIKQAEPVIKPVEQNITVLPEAKPVTDPAILAELESQKPPVLPPAETSPVTAQAIEPMQTPAPETVLAPDGAPLAPVDVATPVKGIAPEVKSIDSGDSVPATATNPLTIQEPASIEPITFTPDNRPELSPSQRQTLESVKENVSTLVEPVKQQEALTAVNKALRGNTLTPAQQTIVTDLHQGGNIPEQSPGTLRNDGITLQSTTIPGGKEFIEQDVMPAMKEARNIIRDTADQFRKVFTPAVRTKDAQQTALNLRELGSRKARKLDSIEKAINVSRKYFDTHGGRITDPNSRAYQFIVNTEYGTIDSLPHIERPFAQMNADILDDLLKEVRKRGKLENVKTSAEKLGTDPETDFEAFYFPRLWKDQEKAVNVMTEIISKRPISGTRAFSKRRTIALFEDGIAAGLEPAYDNPMDLVYHKAAEISKWIMAQDWINGEKEAGRIRFVRVGSKPDEGWKQLDDKFATVYGPPQETLPGPVLLGHYYAPEASATVFNNLVSEGLRGNSAFRTYLGAANIMNQFQLGFSAFHAGFTSLDAMISSLSLGLRQLSHGELKHAIRSIIETPVAAVSNVMRGAKMLHEWDVPGSTTIDIAKLVELAQTGGARAKMDTFYHNEMVKNMLQAFRSGNVIGAALRLPFAAVETTMKPVLEWLVPRQKMGLIAQAAKYELERNPDMTHEEAQKVMAQIVDSVDNRMGQLIYDNLFWNKVAKDLSMASVRSVGWNLGTIREVSGGVKDFVSEGSKAWHGEKPELTYRMSYVLGLPLLVGILGASYQYLSTGEGPKELKDYFFPKTGGLDAHGRPERIALPSYMKDLYHYKSDPGQTVRNKMHPMLSVMSEMLVNKDFYRVEIRHEDDPAMMQLLQLIQHAGKSLEPFASRGLRKNIELGETGVKAALPFIGITPAPASVNKTKAEKLVDEFRAKRMPEGSRTKEQFDKSSQAAKLTRELRLHNPEAGSLIEQAFMRGDITRPQVKEIIQHSTLAPLQISFEPLSYAEATKVMKVATPQEKVLLEPIYFRKFGYFMKNDPINAMKQRMVPGK